MAEPEPIATPTCACVSAGVYDSISYFSYRFKGREADIAKDAADIAKDVAGKPEKTGE